MTADVKDNLVKQLKRNFQQAYKHTEEWNLIVEQMTSLVVDECDMMRKLRTMPSSSDSHLVILTNFARIRERLTQKTVEQASASLRRLEADL